MKPELEQAIEDFKKEVTEMKEFELFLTIESLGGILWREKHDFSDGRLEMSAEDFNENQEHYRALQKECLAMLKKFDVDPESVNDKPNGSYWKWYEFWKTWMNSFHKEEWEDIENKFLQDENVDELLPQKKWNE